MVDNEAIYDICQKSLGVERPSYERLGYLNEEISFELWKKLLFQFEPNYRSSRFIDHCFSPI